MNSTMNPATNKSNESLKVTNKMSTTSSTVIVGDGDNPRTTKAERNLRKKENAKKRKLEIIKKEYDEEQLLAETIALAVEEKRPGNGQTDVTNLKSEEGSQSTEIHSVDDVKVQESPPGLRFKFKACPEKGGVGAFASEAIKRGTEILVEEAIMRGNGEWICKEALFNVLSKEKQDQVLALHAQCNCKSTPCLETPLMKVWNVNAFSATAGPMLYALASRFNHDCLPNIARGFSKEDYIVFRAARDIQAGEELTVSYIISLDSSKVRREQLIDKFGFVCKCRGCASGRDFTLSDMARTVLPQGVEIHSPVYGKYTDEEIVAQAEVQSWFEEINTGLTMMQLNLYSYLEKKAAAGHHSVANSLARGAIVEQFMVEIGYYLRQNNKYDLDDVFFDLYQARNTLLMTEATEKNFFAILENMKEVR